MRTTTILSAVVVVVVQIGWIEFVWWSSAARDDAHYKELVAVRKDHAAKVAVVDARAIAAARDVAKLAEEGAMAAAQLGAARDELKAEREAAAAALDAHRGALRDLRKDLRREALAEADALRDGPSRAGPSVHVWSVSDRKFEARYAPQMTAVQCYAARHSYRHRLIDPADWNCSRRNFFFAKHCAVAAALRDLPPNAVVAVLDADVVPGHDEVGLEAYVDSSDLSFYERGWNPELTSGNYFARNTAFARAFLDVWSRYDSPAPPGFSSYDNGAIQVVVARALRLANAEACADGYFNLTALVDNLDPYFAWARDCGRFRVPGQHVVPGGAPPYTEKEAHRRSLPHPRGRITVVPKRRGFVVDGHLVGWNQSVYASVAPPFFHGLKNAALLAPPFSQSTRCAHLLV